MNGPGHSHLVFSTPLPDTPHHVELGYSNADDGVWLSCVCGWEHNLGFSSSVEQAWEIVQIHRASEDPPP